MKSSSGRSSSEEVWASPNSWKAATPRSIPRAAPIRMRTCRARRMGREYAVCHTRLPHPRPVGHHARERMTSTRPWPQAAWLLMAATLAALAFAVYQGSLDVPFLWDDEIAIVENPRLRTLWPFGDAGYAVQSPESGRPVVRFTLALNHALGGLAVRGYHLFNLAVHVGAALLLFAIVRRTLARFPRWREAAPWLAFLTAAVWLVHPLQSEAVTYVIQRTELVMGFFSLATLLAATH